MKQLIQDKEHLYRMALLFAAGIAFFLLIRVFLVPKSFGMYGHYRGNALADIRALPVVYAGRAACADCHSDVVESRAGSKHAQIGCEACHGPLAAHANDPEKSKAVKPEGAGVCLVCHLRNTARPKGFPQVEPQEHCENETCTTCHTPHHPEIEDEPAEGEASHAGA